MSVLAHDDVLSLGTISPTSSISSLTAYSACDEPDIQHKVYFLQDEHIQLRVGRTVFRIHSHFFLRESSAARALVKQARGTTLDVEDATVDDLERFCDVLYCGYADAPSLHTQAEWTSVLHLAHRWGFRMIRHLAIHKLARLADPVDRVVLAHAYGIPQWLAPAYQELCARDACLSDEEGAKLGLQDVLKITRTHVAIHTKGAELDGPAQLALVNKVFGLECPPAARSGSTSTSLSPQVGGAASVVPASTLPPRINKHHFTARMSIGNLRSIEVSATAVVTTQNEVKPIEAVSEPKAQGTQDNIDKVMAIRSRASILQLEQQAFIDEQTRERNRLIRLYKAQAKATEAKAPRTLAGDAAAFFSRFASVVSERG